MLMRYFYICNYGRDKPWACLGHSLCWIYPRGTEGSSCESFWAVPGTFDEEGLTKLLLFPFAPLC